MNRQALKAGLNFQGKVAQVPCSEVQRQVVVALKEFYARHERKDVPEEDRLLCELANPEYDDDRPRLRQDVEPTAEEEKSFARFWIRVSDDGIVTGADEATRIIKTKRKFYADVRTLLNLVEALLKTLGARIDWAFDLSGHEDVNHFCDDDHPSVLPAD